MKHKALILVIFVSLLTLALILSTVIGKRSFEVEFFVDEQVYETVAGKTLKDMTFPTHPTKEGYDFIGWYTDKDIWQGIFSEETIGRNSLKGTIKVYARWNIESYTISFDSNEGSAVTAITQDFASSVSAPTSPSKEGYTFGGWYFDEALENAYTFTSMPAFDITLFANWTPNEYTISFDSNEGSAVTAITEDFGTPIAGIADPTRLGYTFEGWFTEPELENPYVLSTIPAQNLILYAAWAEEIQTEGLSYTPINEGNNYSVSFGSATDTDIIIPSLHEGKIVTSINQFGFMGRESITSITIPDTITSIGLAAFLGCASLEEINVGVNNTAYSSLNGNLYDKEAITLIQYALGKEDTSFVIPESVTRIENYAFYFSTNLTSIQIPTSVTSIGEYAFTFCTSLTSITIPSGVTVIEEQAFSNCSSLTSIEIPSSVTSIAKEAFSNCSSLTNIAIPNTVTSIGGSAFSYCTSLTSITIPSSISMLLDYLFSYCSSLTSIIIPSSVTSFGVNVFQECTSLTTIIIPSSVTNIGYFSFAGCDILTINAEAESKPSGWSELWNSDYRPVNWGYVA